MIAGETVLLPQCTRNWRWRNHQMAMGWVDLRSFRNFVTDASGRYYGQTVEVFLELVTC